MNTMCTHVVRSKIPAAGRIRRPAHRVGLGRLHAQRERRQSVGQQVDPQDLDRQQRQRHAGQRPGDHDEDLAEIARQDEPDELPDVVEDDASLFDRRDDAREVVVLQHHVRRVLRHVGAGDAHGDADVRLLQRRRVVDAVAGHRHDVPARLQGLHDVQLLLGLHPRVDADPLDQRGQLGSRTPPPARIRSRRRRPPAGRSRARRPPPSADGRR